MRKLSNFHVFSTFHFSWLILSCCCMFTSAWVPTIQRPPTALTSAMTPLFPTQAWEGKEFRVTELQEMFTQALQHFQDLMASSASFVDNIDIHIATSVATAVRGHPNVVSNAEMYSLARQGLDHIIMTLARVLETLDGLSIEQKIAAALATVVISYPISYQHYQNEIAEEERKAAEKKAAITKQKKAAAAAAAKAKGKTGKETVKATKVSSSKETVVMVKEKKIPTGPKGVTKTEPVEEMIPVEAVATPVTPVETQVTPPTTPSERVVTVEIPASPRVIESVPVIGNRAEDGGMDAYARAYAAMLAQVQAVKVAETLPPVQVTESSMPGTAPAVPTARISTGGTASYLESLSRRP